MVADLNVKTAKSSIFDLIDQFLKLETNRKIIWDMTNNSSYFTPDQVAQFWIAVLFASSTVASTAGLFIYIALYTVQKQLDQPTSGSHSNAHC